MRSLITLLFLSLLFSAEAQTSAVSQSQKFSVGEFEFKMKVPLKWQTTATKDGICKDKESNLDATATFPCKKCAGTMIVALSAITPEEKEERKNHKDDYDPNELADVSYVDEIDEYKLGSGYYEGNLSGNLYYYTNAQGQFIQKKKMSAAKRLIPIHIYSRWYYFPFNDSLELIIAFNGMISHDDENTVDAAMMEFTENFFRDNKTTIDTLLNQTDPYRNEPEKWPLDSVAFWNTHLKFPTIDGWYYTFNGARTPEKVTHVNANILKTEQCDEGSIVITSQVQPVNPKDNINKEYAQFIKKNFGKGLAEEYLKKATDTSGFSEQEHHCSMDVVHNTEERTDCNNSTRNMDTVHIYIYLSAYKRIDLSVAFTMSSTNDIRSAKYYHDFSRFVGEFIEANDFEKVYQLNKE